MSEKTAIPNVKLSAEEIILELKTRFGAGTDVDLAQKLGVDPATVSAWRTRGSVPLKYRVRKLDDETRQRLIDSLIVPSLSPVAKRLIFVLLAKTARILSAKVSFENVADADVWSGRELARLHERLALLFLKIPRDDEEKTKALFTDIALRLEQADVLDWLAQD